MRFAILGSHPDGLAFADALAASGRHRVAVYTTAVPAEHLARWGGAARRVADLEEVLADPDVEAVIVAGSPANRPFQLRRALQSERHVLCVHPCDDTPDLAYEAAMIQRDTGRVLLPLLAEGLHPGVLRLASLCRPGGELGVLRLAEMERRAPAAVAAGGAGGKLSLPGWDVLRRLGGDAAEVTAYAEAEEPAPDAPLFLSGRFQAGGLFRVSLLPGQPGPHWRLAVTGERARAELIFASGWPGPAVLTWEGADGAAHEETWEAWEPGPVLVDNFELAARRAEARGPRLPPSGLPPLSWQDEVRCLELDDAARRSVHHRRATALEYPDATEEAGIKGTMTLVGCSLLWGILLLAILSAWLPVLGYLVVPVLVLFLALQVALWLISRRAGTAEQPRQAERPDEDVAAPAADSPATSEHGRVP